MFIEQKLSGRSRTDVSNLLDKINSQINLTKRGHEKLPVNSHRLLDLLELKQIPMADGVSVA